MTQPRTGNHRVLWLSLAVLLLVVLGALWWRASQSIRVPTEVPFAEAPVEDPGIFGLVSAERQDPTGTISVLVIFAQFAEEARLGDAPPKDAEDLLDPDRPGSLTHYYHTMSTGQLRIDGIVLPKRYTSREPAAAYLASTPTQWGRYPDFAREILEQVDEDVDFGRISSSSTCLGKKYHGAMLKEDTFDRTAGVMAHEFGHALGLPDLYDLDYQDNPRLNPTEDSAGIGRWGLMGHGVYGWSGQEGPGPMSAWSREQMGWLGRDNERLEVVESGPSPLALRDIDLGGVVYKVWLGEDDDFEDEREYLLLEYRSRAAHDYNLQSPADGLLVWHVRPRVIDNRDETYKWVDLVSADGTYRDAGYAPAEPTSWRGTVATRRAARWAAASTTAACRSRAAKRTSWPWRFCADTDLGAPESLPVDVIDRRLPPRSAETVCFVSWPTAPSA